MSRSKFTSEVRTALVGRTAAGVSLALAILTGLARDGSVIAAVNLERALRDETPPALDPHELLERLYQAK